jgi:hypothetical protein
MSNSASHQKLLASLRDLPEIRCILLFVSTRYSGRFDVTAESVAAGHYVPSRMTLFSAGEEHGVAADSNFDSGLPIIARFHIFKFYWPVAVVQTIATVRIMMTTHVPQAMMLAS